jgi:hypothetical protein
MLLEISITKLLAKPTKEKEREKEGAIYWKIAPLKALVDREGWKVSLFKGIYVARLSTLIQMIWLKGNQLTFVAKKLMDFAVLVEQGVKVN